MIQCMQASTRPKLNRFKVMDSILKKNPITGIHIHVTDRGGVPNSGGFHFST